MMIAVGLNLFPFRTEKLKPLAPKILEEISGKIGRRRDIVHNIMFGGFPLKILYILLVCFFDALDLAYSTSYYSRI